VPSTPAESGRRAVDCSQVGEKQGRSRGEAGEKQGRSRGEAGEKQGRRRETTMQRNDLVALVAGTSVGVVGGAFGVFLACIAGEAAVRRFLIELGDHYIELGDHYIELSQPPLPSAPHGAMQANAASASATPASVPSLPAAKGAVTVALSR
jgi:hypothetical protein